MQYHAVARALINMSVNTGSNFATLYQGVFFGWLPRCCYDIQSNFWYVWLSGQCYCVWPVAKVLLYSY